MTTTFVCRMCRFLRRRNQNIFPNVLCFKPGTKMLPPAAHQPWWVTTIRAYLVISSRWGGIMCEAEPYVCDQNHIHSSGQLTISRGSTSGLTVARFHYRANCLDEKGEDPRYETARRYSVGATCTRCPFVVFRAKGSSHRPNRKDSGNSSTLTVARDPAGESPGRQQKTHESPRRDRKLSKELGRSVQAIQQRRMDLRR